MKTLVEDDLMGYDTVAKVLMARIERSGSVSLGDRYRVPHCYIPSGIGEVTNIDGFTITKDGDTESFWVIDLEAAVAEPDNPCDSDFMEDISS
jgi:hypothetical protein